MVFSEVIKDIFAVIFHRRERISKVIYLKEQNAADQHCYLLIKAALALLHSVYTFEPSLNLQIPPLKRNKVVAQKRQL